MMLLAVLVLVASAAALSPIVETTFGSVEGFYANNAFKWLGVPYAAPPTGALRFQNAIPPEPWEDVLETMTMPPGCPQYCTSPPGMCPNTTSESCLFLNVFAPANASGLPVMAFLFGG